MAFTTEEKDEIKRMVLTEIERLFADLGNKYNTAESHEKMLFLLDIESSVKQGLMDADEREQTTSA